MKTMKHQKGLYSSEAPIRARSSRVYRAGSRLGILLFTFGLFTVTRVAEPNVLTHPQTAPASSTAAIRSVESFIRHEMTDKELPALSIALVEDQQIIWAKGFGYQDPDRKIPATDETVYRVGSVSKLFTDIAIMQLVEQGKLDLDVPVTRYLPDFRPRQTSQKAITLRQLMAHRSGLVREPPIGHYFDPTLPTLAQTIGSLNQTTLIYQPEERPKYSNAAIATAGYVLERTQGEPFAKYVKRTVLDSFGMPNSSFEPSAEINRRLAKAYMWTLDGRVFPAPTFELGMSPAGSMYSTVQDLGRFLSLLFAGGGTVLKRETLEQMWTPQFAPTGQRRGFGIGFFVNEMDGHRLIGHGGAIYGFATSLLALPDDKLGVIVVTTKDSANAVTDKIARAALSAMLAARERQVIPQPPISQPLEAELARRLAGRYENGKEVIELQEHHGTLSMLDHSTGGQVRLRADGNGLIVDDRTGFGIKISVQGDDLVIDRRTFKRVAIGKPLPVSASLKGLVGEYGWDHNVLYIFEKDGKLWALIEWYEFDPLEQVSENTFRFPDRGLYHGEKLVFKRDRLGRATEVEAASVVFTRRAVGPEEGAKQLKISPVRPVRDLLKEALRATPPQESGEFLPSDLVELTKLDATIKLDVRYATTDNFLNSVFYSQARAFLQRPAAQALVRAHRNLKKQGYGLLIHDGYRPWYVTKVFWEATPDDKKIFVANPAQGSRHNRGCAVDLSLYNLQTGKPVDMVSTYDETTDRAYPNYPGGTSLQRWHRELLRRAMESEGFTVYEAEWWHFDFREWRRYRIGTATFESLGK